MKGNLFWSTGRGKLGDMVLRIRKGEQIGAKYQPVVTNPKTDSQMRQRALFANCVKFYKRGNQSYFRFAYEDKKQSESDYNAFVRHNVGASAYLLRDQVRSTEYPAVGENWMIGEGSLAEAVLNDVRAARPYLSCPSLVAEVGTIGELSAALIADYGLHEGDFATFVRITSDISNLTDSAKAAPVWDIVQFEISTASSGPITDLSDNFQLQTALGLYLEKQTTTTAVWYGVVFSRKAKTKLYVSDAYLKGNYIAYNLYAVSQTADWKQKVLDSWESTGTAILEGSIAETRIEEVATIETCSGQSIPRISDTTFDANVESSAVLTGTNLNLLNVAKFVGVGVAVTKLNITSAIEATITLKGDGKQPNTWSLYYGSTLIARHSQITANITSISPTSVNVLDAGDTTTFVLEGTNLDGLTVDSFTSSDDKLRISDIVISDGGKKATVTLTADEQVSAATISYQEKIIFEIKEVEVTITSKAVTISTSGTHTITLTGTGLSRLTTLSFADVVDASCTGCEIVSYENDVDDSDFKAYLKISLDGFAKGTLYYKTQVIVNYDTI